MIGTLITKPLLIGAGVAVLALVALLGVQTLRLKWAQAEVATVTAARITAESQRDAALNEREAWKGKASTLEQAGLSWQNVAGERLALLAECQAEHSRIYDANEKAVAEAQAAAADAERTLSLFVSRYAERNRAPSCAAARAELDRACAAVEY